MNFVSGWWEIAIASSRSSTFSSSIKSICNETANPDSLGYVPELCGENCSHHNRGLFQKVKQLKKQLLLMSNKFWVFWFSQTCLFFKFRKIKYFWNWKGML